MKCHFCLKEGLKSVLYPGASMTTLMGFGKWYDEDGNLHNHDGNTVTSPFHCSEGHYYHTKGHNPCPAPGCGWPHEEPEFIRTDQ